MNRPETLLNRLDAIAAELAARANSMALIGLGSVGRDTARLDAWSDLDFFVVVERGAKAAYVESLDWLDAVHPLAWSFRNTVDGHKALMADGVFCEFAVFEPAELVEIPFAPGRLVWARDGVDPAIATPRRAMPQRRSDAEWIVGEALSCLYVGLQRWHRGEKLSAARFVQGHALDRLIEWDALRTPVSGGDPFNSERRLEQLQPELAAELAALVPGYTQTPAAARALLQALQRRGAHLHPAIVARIEALI